MRSFHAPLRTTARPLLSALLVAHVLAPAASAQTPAAEVMDAANATLLRVNTDGGLIGLGAFGIGTIPATGAGTRLMWHPAKAAFRAGAVFGTQWDDANVGVYSVALGQSTTASGNFSTAMGNTTTASGIDATAMGVLTTAQAFASVALGRFNTVSGTPNAWVATDPLLVVGDGTSAADRSNALLLRKDAGFVVGGAFGVGTIPATGKGVRMMWYPAKAAFRAGSVDASQWDEPSVGDHSFAAGHNTTASGDFATAMGSGTVASGFLATTMGNGTEASGTNATAMGFSTLASGGTSTAMGIATTAQANASVAIGRFNVVSGTATVWDPAEPLLVGGDGTSHAARSNSFVIFKSGAAQFQGTVTATVAAPSDLRLKEDVAPLGPALARVLRLRPVTYRYRVETERSRAVQIGLVAQEVGVLFPELVETAPDGFLSVQYGNLAPVAVAAIQEQQAVIERQATEIATLRAELAGLRDLPARLAALERRLDAAPARERRLDATPAAPAGRPR